MLTGLIRLRSLDLSSNKLTKIDGALETLTALQQLNLRGNALLVLGPDAFKVSYSATWIHGGLSTTFGLFYRSLPPPLADSSAHFSRINREFPFFPSLPPQRMGKIQFRRDKNNTIQRRTGSRRKIDAAASHLPRQGASNRVL